MYHEGFVPQMNNARDPVAGLQRCHGPRDELAPREVLYRAVVVTVLDVLRDMSLQLVFVKLCIAHYCNWQSLKFDIDVFNFTCCETDTAPSLRNSRCRMLGARSLLNRK